MCGIAGVFSLNNHLIDWRILDKMAQSLGHRGPDSRGVYIKSPVGLAHTRLSIIDLSPAGTQPMPNEDQSIYIVYNGEIYNHIEIKKDLVAKGHLFRSKSDTEVILHLYEEMGEECVSQLNGMFAFAIWDEREQKLFLARDRYGIKPLYYFNGPGTFIFASEIKAILEVNATPVELNLRALNEYFSFQNTLEERTLFQGIYLLSPGHTLRVKRNSVIKHQYWDLVFHEEERSSKEILAREVRQAFEKSVKQQLISDVPVGAYLSGGMDSGSITAVASQHIPMLMTFTAGFDLSSVTGLELAFDERKEAELVSNTFLTEHYEMVMHSGDMARVLPRLVWHLEDLRMGMSYQNYYIAQLASKFVKVALSGVGGDEVFAGYYWRYQPILDRWQEEEFDKYYFPSWIRLVPDSEKGSFFSDDIYAETHRYSNFETYRSLIEKVANASPLHKALYFEMKTFLAGLLIVEDKLSMAHSLEVRLPFLDNELVALTARISSAYKLNGIYSKYILRKAMEGLLPEAILRRKKQGFSPPDGSWYKGETMKYIKEILLDPRSLSRGYFKPGYIYKTINEHLSGRVNHRLLIWSLLCFEWWNRLFQDNRRFDS